MFALFSLLLGCYAHAHEVHTHYSGCEHSYAYVTHGYPASRWIPGYYTPAGMWVPGRWVTYTVRPVPPPVYVTPPPRRAGSPCHRHRDGMTHCGRH